MTRTPKNVSPDPTRAMRFQEPNQFIVPERYPFYGWGSGSSGLTNDDNHAEPEYREILNKYHNTLWELYGLFGEQKELRLSREVLTRYLTTSMLTHVFGRPEGAIDNRQEASVDGLALGTSALAKLPNGKLLEYVVGDSTPILDERLIVKDVDCCAEISLENLVKRIKEDKGGEELDVVFGELTSYLPRLAGIRDGMIKVYKKMFEYAQKKNRRTWEDGAEKMIAEARDNISYISRIISRLDSVMTAGHSQIHDNT